MQTISDYLKNLPQGGVVTNRRLLAALKRKGLIYDYSAYGYLESPNVQYPWGDGTYSSQYPYLFAKGNAPRQYRVVCETSDEYYEKYSDSEIEYRGVKFRTKYLDGCFNAYLYRVSPNESGAKASPRMSVFGAIV